MPQVTLAHDAAEALLFLADRIVDAERAGHPVWGDGRALDRGWAAMLAWNLGLAMLLALASCQRGEVG